MFLPNKTIIGLFTKYFAQHCSNGKSRIWQKQKNTKSFTLKWRWRTYFSLYVIGLELWHIKSFVRMHMYAKMYDTWSNHFGVTVKHRNSKFLAFRMKVKNDLGEFRRPHVPCRVVNECQCNVSLFRRFEAIVQRVKFRQFTLTTKFKVIHDFVKVWRPYASRRHLHTNPNN